MINHIRICSINIERKYVTIFPLLVLSGIKMSSSYAEGIHSVNARASTVYLFGVKGLGRKMGIRDLWEWLQLFWDFESLFVRWLQVCDGRHLTLLFVIPQKCTFLANNLMKAGGILIFRLMILFQLVIMKNLNCSCLPRDNKRTNRVPCFPRHYYISRRVFQHLKYSEG